MLCLFQGFHISNVPLLHQLAGPSMLPTFEAQGEVVVVEHVSPLLGWLKTGKCAGPGRVLLLGPMGPGQITTCFPH